MRTSPEEAKVLVVDDFQTMREMMKACLRQLGYKDIRTAENGEDALTLIAEGDFDLILCDWHMPGKKGIDVLKEVRKARGAGIPFIMATSESEQSCVIQAIESGVSNYIIKPFNVDTLRKKIESAVKKAASAGPAAPSAPK
jgi:two-component system, chemotaxis family, chemotaxis protein CheY